MARRAKRRREQGAGTVDQLPSGRWRARYRDEQGKQRSAPTTFDTRLDAEAWLDGAGADEVEEKRVDPTLKEYADTWLAARDLKARTRAEYRRLLDVHVLPALGSARLSRLTTAQVRAWHAALDPATPTSGARLRAAQERADHRRRGRAPVQQPVPDPQGGNGEDPAPAAPGDAAGTAGDRRGDAAAVPGDGAARCVGGLRFGELTELRRHDIDGNVVRVSRGAVRVEGTYLVGDPKSDAGRRTVTVPPHLVPVLEEHLRQHVDPSGDALLFPAPHGGHMAPSSLYRVWYPAREAAGRPDLRWHDLRHTGATLAAATGATLAYLMAGWGTPRLRPPPARRAGPRRAVAEALSGFATAGSVGLVAREK